MARLTKEESQKRLLKKLNENTSQSQSDVNELSADGNSEGYSNNNDHELTDENLSSNSDNFDDVLLKTKTVQRDYAQAHIETKGIIPESVDEPQIEAPTIDFNNMSDGSDNDGSEIVAEKRFEPGSVTNPGYHDLTPKQKNSSAEYLADTAINAYVVLNTWGKKFAQFDQNKMQQMAIDGKFDFAILDMELPLSEVTNETISIRQLLDDINTKADEIYVVSEEFKRECKPILIEIFKKKGWGLTPENRLLALFVEDALPKIATMVQLRGSINYFIKVSMQILEHEHSKGQATPNNSNARAQQQSYEQNHTTTQQEYENIERDKRKPENNITDTIEEYKPESEDRNSETIRKRKINSSANIKAKRKKRSPGVISAKEPEEIQNESK